MKIVDYQKITDLSQTSVFLVDGPSGTKTIFAKDLLKALNNVTPATDSIGNINTFDLKEITKLAEADRLLIGTDSSEIRTIRMEDFLYEYLDSFISVEARRNIFRGKNLGSVYTLEQKARIADGTFKGFFIGDYWEIDEKIWRIVDINYWLNTGDTSCTTPHLVIMPDKPNYLARVHSAYPYTVGYAGTELYETKFDKDMTLLSSAFGENHILNHREYLTNAVSDHRPSGMAWFDSRIELPNEVQLFGYISHQPATDGTFQVQRSTIDSTQFALMRLCRKFINPSRESFWLRDISTDSYFIYVNGEGHLRYHVATTNYGIRVVFGLT